MSSRKIISTLLLTIEDKEISIFVKEYYNDLIHTIKSELIEYVHELPGNWNSLSHRLRTKRFDEPKTVFTIESFSTHIDVHSRYDLKSKNKEIHDKVSYTLLLHSDIDLGKNNRLIFRSLLKNMAIISTFNLPFEKMLPKLMTNEEIDRSFLATILILDNLIEKLIDTLEHTVKTDSIITVENYDEFFQQLTPLKKSLEHIKTAKTYNRAALKKKQITLRDNLITKATNLLKVLETFSPEFYNDLAAQNFNSKDTYKLETELNSQLSSSSNQNALILADPQVKLEIAKNKINANDPLYRFKLCLLRDFNYKNLNTLTKDDIPFIKLIYMEIATAPTTIDTISIRNETIKELITVRKENPKPYKKDALIKNSVALLNKLYELNINPRHKSHKLPITQFLQFNKFWKIDLSETISSMAPEPKVTENRQDIDELRDTFLTKLYNFPIFQCTLKTADAMNERSGGFMDLSPYEESQYFRDYKSLFSRLKKAEPEEVKGITDLFLEKFIRYMYTYTKYSLIDIVQPCYNALYNINSPFIHKQKLNTISEDNYSYIFDNLRNRNTFETLNTVLETYGTQTDTNYRLDFIEKYPNFSSLPKDTTDSINPRTEGHKKIMELFIKSINKLHNKDKYRTRTFAFLKQISTLKNPSLLNNKNHTLLVTSIYLFYILSLKTTKEATLTSFINCINDTMQPKLIINVINLLRILASNEDAFKISVAEFAKKLEHNKKENIKNVPVKSLIPADINLKNISNINTSKILEILNGNTPSLPFLNLVIEILDKNNPLPIGIEFYLKHISSLNTKKDHVDDMPINLGTSCEKTKQFFLDMLFNKAHMTYNKDNKRVSIASLKITVPWFQNYPDIKSNDLINYWLTAKTLINFTSDSALKKKSPYLKHLNLRFMTFIKTLNTLYTIATNAAAYQLTRGIEGSNHKQIADRQLRMIKEKLATFTKPLLVELKSTTLDTVNPDFVMQISSTFDTHFPSALFHDTTTADKNGNNLTYNAWESVERFKESILNDTVRTILIKKQTPYSNEDKLFYESKLQCNEFLEIEKNYLSESSPETVTAPLVTFIEDAIKRPYHPFSKTNSPLSKFVHFIILMGRICNHYESLQHLYFKQYSTEDPRKFLNDSICLILGVASHTDLNGPLSSTMFIQALNSGLKGFLNADNALTHFNQHNAMDSFIQKVIESDIYACLEGKDTYLRTLQFDLVPIPQTNWKQAIENNTLNQHYLTSILDTYCEEVYLTTLIEKAIIDQQQQDPNKGIVSIMFNDKSFQVIYDRTPQSFTISIYNYDEDSFRRNLAQKTETISVPELIFHPKVLNQLLTTNYPEQFGNLSSTDKDALIQNLRTDSIFKTEVQFIEIHRPSTTSQEPETLLGKRTLSISNAPRKRDSNSSSVESTTNGINLDDTQSSPQTSTTYSSTDVYWNKLEKETTASFQQLKKGTVHEFMGLDKTLTTHLAVRIGSNIIISIPNEQIETPFISFNQVKRTLNIDSEIFRKLLFKGSINFNEVRNERDINEISIRLPDEIILTIGNALNEEKSIREAFSPYLYDFSQLLRSIETLPFKTNYGVSNQLRFVQALIDNSFEAGLSILFFQEFPDFSKYLNSPNKSELTDLHQILKRKLKNTSISPIALNQHPNHQVILMDVDGPIPFSAVGG
jgi:hypothetical protein